MELLVKYNADITLKDSRGFSAIDYAKQFNDNRTYSNSKIKNYEENYFLSLLFLVTSAVIGQTYSTGTITLTNTSGLAMTLRLDVGSQVSMTLTGPADRWFSVGFGATSMTAGTDVVLVHTGATLTSFDRVLPGFGAPTAEAIQNWTINSNTVSGNVRTITATRALNTGGFK